MKSVLIISVVTFFLIFGGLAVLSGQLGGGGTTHPEASNPASAVDTEMIMKGITAERTLLRKEKEELMSLRETVVVQEVVLKEGRRELAAILREMESRQRILDEGQERSASRLAKMYENMKPAQAAPILSGLEMDIVLDVMDRMKEREAARILAHMDTALAAQISTELSHGGSS